MDFTSQLVPALIILVANLLSGKHSSLQWEYVTAIFGWGAGISLLLVIAALFIPGAKAAESYLMQLFGFCLLTALSRDYERMFWRFFPWNRE